jgi:hypothetical protein
MKYRKTSLALLLATLITGCAEDGENGVNGNDGVNGTNGVNGTDGTDGKDATTMLEIELVGRAQLNASDPEGAAEIVSYQNSTGWVYAINSSASPAVVEIIDINGMDKAELTADTEGVITNTNLTASQTINLATSASLSGDANSIAVDNNNNLLAVAVDSGTKGVNGHVAFYDISGAAPSFIKNVEVGDLPDNVVFSHDGKKVLVANEGEPADDYVIDPEGSISVINVTDGVPADTATQITFEDYNDKQQELEQQGVKFANPNGLTIKGQVRTYTVAQDLEPEYITVSKDNSKAYVSLQDNNAMAIVNLSDNSVKVVGLGVKDWSEYQIDVSDKDDGINFKKYQHLYGLYQPDTIDSYQWNGVDFVVSANEGDAREYIAFERDAAEDAGKAECETDFPSGSYEWDDGEEVCIAYTDEVRAKDLEDLATVTPELDAYISEMGGNDGLGRLIVTSSMGKNDDGEYADLYSFGARSFSIWDQNGLLIFDSGDQIAKITAAMHGSAFNNNEDENVGDTRSDAKGAEPEALALGKIGNNTYAFVGLERMSGMLVFDITNPYDVSFVDYFFNRGLVEDADITGDLAPEGMKFIDAAHSPTNQALLVIGNEISGTVAIWQINEK